MSTATERPDRQRFLKPFLDRLAALDEHSGSPGLPTRINIGTHSLRIEPWERGVVLGSLKGGKPDVGGEWPTLLADAVALEVKGLSDLHRLAQDAEPNGSGAEPLRGELETDAVFGSVLMTEIQEAVDRLVVAGDVDLARKLTRFRNKLGRHLAEIRDSIGEEGAGRVDFLAAELIAEAAASSEAEGGRAKQAVARPGVAALLRLDEDLNRVRQPDDAPPRGIIVTRSSSDEPRRPRVLPLLAVLGVSVAAWLLITVRPAVTKVEFPVFAATDFQDVPALVDVLAKPPALYVTVDGEEWGRLSTDEKTRSVEAIASRIASAEYTGANLTDAGGRTVARWLRHTGVELIGGP